MFEPYDRLANAIILAAVADWREAVVDLERNSRDRKALGVKRECERFFLSRWFSALTEIDGKEMLTRLREEARI